MRKILSVFFIFFFVLFFTSCQTFSPYPRVKEFHKSLDLQEKSSIYFENMHGDLEIIGWEKNTVEINAKKAGTDSQLRQTDIEIKKKGNDLSIKTYFPRGDVKNVFVDFELRVPEKILFKEIKIQKGDLSSIQIYGELKALIAEGKIDIEDFSGTCDLTTEEGTIVARIFESKKDDNLFFKTTNGDIRIYLPPQLNAQIDAETHEGDISSDFILEEKMETPLKTWKETFGTGEAKIHLKSWKGKIQIKKIEPSL